jgi:hypothetical protein
MQRSISGLLVPISRVMSVILFPSLHSRRIFERWTLAIASVLLWLIRVSEEQLEHF